MRGLWAKILMASKGRHVEKYCPYDGVQTVFAIHGTYTNTGMKSLCTVPDVVGPVIDTVRQIWLTASKPRITVAKTKGKTKGTLYFLKDAILSLAQKRGTVAVSGERGPLKNINELEGWRLRRAEEV